jgi:hypothetical protein
MYFPPNLEVGNLYPDESTVYVTDDGATYDVGCFTPGEVAAAEEVSPEKLFVTFRWNSLHYLLLLPFRSFAQTLFYAQPNQMKFETVSSPVRSVALVNW